STQVYNYIFMIFLSFLSFTLFLSIYSKVFTTPPVSSKTSLIAAVSALSPSSTLPPGNSIPLVGCFVNNQRLRCRHITQTCFGFLLNGSLSKDKCTLFR